MPTDVRRILARWSAQPAVLADLQTLADLLRRAEARAQRAERAEQQWRQRSQAVIGGHPTTDER